jgi:hypothetical protein
LTVSAHTEHRKIMGLAIRGTRGASGPGTADLRAEATVSITPGTVENMELSVDPPILYAGQRATAFVTVRLQDRASRPVIDEVVLIDASEGAITPLELQNDGSWVAEYTPEPGITSRREITLTARVKSSGRAASTRMEVLASPVNGAIGLSMGAITNFGQINPIAGLVADLRTPLVARTVMFRFGVGQHWLSHNAGDALGGDTRVRLSIYAIRAGLLIRRDHRGRAFWLGAQGVLAPYWAQLRVDDDVVSSGLGVLPGASVVAGVGLRAGFGEVVFELEGLALPGPRGDLAYQGTVGGVSAGLSYRIVY